MRRFVEHTRSLVIELASSARARSDGASGVPGDHLGDPKVLDGRFGNYIDLLGYHPTALAVLSAVTFALFSGGELLPQITAERILLATPAEVEAGARGK